MKARYRNKKAFFSVEGLRNNILKGSMLGSVIFKLIINYVDLRVCNELAEFTDDTKWCGEVKTENVSEKLQKVCFRMDEQAIKPTAMCEVMYIAHRQKSQVSFIS